MKASWCFREKASPRVGLTVFVPAISMILYDTRGTEFVSTCLGVEATRRNILSLRESIKLRVDLTQVFGYPVTRFSALGENLSFAHHLFAFVGEPYQGEGDHISAVRSVSPNMKGRMLTPSLAGVIFHFCRFFSVRTYKKLNTFVS